MYANKVNGSTAPGDFVTSNFDYIAFSSTVNILQNGVTSNGSTGTLTTQAALDKLIEIVSLRGQPVMIGVPVYDGTTYYTFRVAVEHSGAWAGATPALSGVGGAIALHGIDVGFSGTNVTTVITATI